MSKKRLDELIVFQEKASSIKEAQQLILSGKVRILNKVMDKCGTPIDENASIDIIQNSISYVSRGGLKIESAWKVFKFKPHDKVALDIGLSTGGFTDFLLQHGAKHVIGIDVGYGQVDWKIQSDKRVTILERINARYPDKIVSKLQKKGLADLLSIVSLVVMDVSFISITKID